MYRVVLGAKFKQASERLKEESLLFKGYFGSG